MCQNEGLRRVSLTSGSPGGSQSLIGSVGNTTGGGEKQLGMRGILTRLQGSKTLTGQQWSRKGTRWSICGWELYGVLTSAGPATLKVT